MKTNWKWLGWLGGVLLLAGGCVSKTTAPVVTGAVVQFTACELAKAKPAAKAPLHAAGVTLRAFGSDAPPTQEVLASALAAIDCGDAVTATQVNAMWSVVTAAYGELYLALKTPEQKATLQLWFTQVGLALDNGSQCGAPLGVLRAPAAVPAGAPTWAELGDQLKASLRQVRPGTR